MIRHGLRARISALIAAYALVLYAMLVGIAPLAHPPGNASLASAIVCAGASGTDQPAGQDRQDHSSCVLHCLFAGGATDAWTPATTGILATFAPADLRVSIFKPVESRGGATTQQPQIPRAPPLA